MIKKFLYWLDWFFDIDYLLTPITIVTDRDSDFDIEIFSIYVFGFKIFYKVVNNG